MAPLAAVAVSWVLIFGGYYLLPLSDLTNWQSVVRIGIGIVALVAVLAWQLRQIGRARRPVMRAVRALGTGVAVFLVSYAAGYLALSQSSSTNFSETLDHTGAFYLTVTTFSSVGYGDITPTSELARLVVSTQMILDLVVLGAMVRVIVLAAKSARTSASP